MRALEVLQTTDWISSITEEFRAKLRELTVTGMNTDLKRIDLVDRFNHFFTILWRKSVYFQLKGFADLA